MNDITTWSMKKLFTELRCGDASRVIAAEFEVERRIKQQARKDVLKEVIKALMADNGKRAPTSVVRTMLFDERKKSPRGPSV